MKMSKIGQEAAALMHDDMGKPVVFKGHIDENGFYVPTPEEEEEMQEGFRLWQLKGYTTEELEEELDSRITNTSDVDARQSRRK